MDSLGLLFGPNCEVVLHSLHDLSKSVIKIVNGHVTGRKEGAPLTNLGIDVLEKAELLDSDLIGPYFTQLHDGRTVKSITTLIRDEKGEPIGMLCINFDISAPFFEIVETFSPKNEKKEPNTVEHFPETPQELINKSVISIRKQVSKMSQMSPAASTKYIVSELFERGIFNVKGAIDLVSIEFGLSRNTIYNYIRDAKRQARSK